MTKTDENMHQDLMMKTGMLVEALPFMRRYSGKTILVKFGGHAMGKADYVAAFASDIALLDQVGACPVVVHGGAEAAVIMDGRAPHALLVELFTEHGMGTMIKADEELS